jgi:hypothetical protein
MSEGNGFKRNRKTQDEFKQRNLNSRTLEDNNTMCNFNSTNQEILEKNKVDNNDTLKTQKGKPVNDIHEANLAKSPKNSILNKQISSNYDSNNIIPINKYNASNWETFTKNNNQIETTLQNSKTNSYLKTYNNNVINNANLFESIELKFQLKSLKIQYKNILKEISDLNEDINDKDDEESRIFKTLNNYQNNKETQVENHNSFSNSNINKENTSINFNFDKEKVPQANNTNNNLSHEINLNNLESHIEVKKSRSKGSLLELKSQITNLNRTQHKQIKDLEDKMLEERKKKLENIDLNNNEKITKYKQEKDKIILDLQNLILNKQEKLSKVLNTKNYNEESADKDYYLYIHNLLHEIKVSQLRNKFSTEVLQIKEIIHIANQIENSFYEDLSKKESNGNKAEKIESIIKDIDIILTNHSNYMENIINPNLKNGYAPNLNLNIYGSLCSMLNSQNKEASSRLYSSSSRKVFQNQLKNKKHKDVNPLSSNRYSQASISDQNDSDQEKNPKEIAEKNKLKKTKYQSDKKGGKCEKNILKTSHEIEDNIENYGSQINEFSHRRIENKLTKSKRKLNKNRSQESVDFSVEYSSYDVDFDEINDEIKINKVNSMRIDTEFFEKKNNLVKKLKK